MVVLWVPDSDLSLSEQGKGKKVTVIIRDACYVSDRVFISKAYILVTWTVRFGGLSITSI